MRPLRLLIVDDQPAFRAMLEALLDLDPRFQVVGAVGDGYQAIKHIADAVIPPDVVLMDIAMPGLDGIEATRRISQHAAPVRVVILTGSQSADDVDAARHAGAVGYIHKAQLDRLPDTLAALA